MKAMTKRVFRAILERQRASGLSIREFCQNESYNPASFHYWKSKFGFTCSQGATGHQASNDSADFVPVRFQATTGPPIPTGEEVTKALDAIMIELPTGIKIYFRGSFGTQAATQLITQMYTGHVLFE